MNAPIAIRVTALAAALAAGLLATAGPALAGHAYGHERHEWRERHGYFERRWCPPPPPRVVYRAACPPTVFVRPASGLSVTFSGVFGPVAIGARVDRPLPWGYAYADPYCGITFDSLTGYAEHCWHQHPAVAEVVRMRGPCERHDWIARGGDDEDDDEDGWRR